MGQPDIRKPDGTELTPHVTLRIALDLYAGRQALQALTARRQTPLAKSSPRTSTWLILREQTDGPVCLAERRQSSLAIQVATGTLVTPRSRAPSCEFAFQLRLARDAEESVGSVTIRDKCEHLQELCILPKIFDRSPPGIPASPARHTYISASLYLVQKPQQFDVIVTEIFSDDILSDLAAGLIAAWACPPRASIRRRHAFFQPSHVTAARTRGQGNRHPIAAIPQPPDASWIADCTRNAICGAAPRLSISGAVAEVLAEARCSPSIRRHGRRRRGCQSICESGGQGRRLVF